MRKINPQGGNAKTKEEMSRTKWTNHGTDPTVKAMTPWLWPTQWAWSQLGQLTSGLVPHVLSFQIRLLLQLFCFHSSFVWISMCDDGQVTCLLFYMSLNAEKFIQTWWREPHVSHRSWALIWSHPLGRTLGSSPLGRSKGFSVYGWKNLHNQSGRLLERLLNCTLSSLFSFYSMVTSQKKKFLWGTGLPSCDSISQIPLQLDVAIYSGQWNMSGRDVYSYLVVPLKRSVLVFILVFISVFFSLFPTICNHLIIFQHILI